MPKQSIPPYKPSRQIEQQFGKDNQRHNFAVLPKRSWVHRNPKLFQISFITASLLIFFSKPLYDAFIVETFPVSKH